MAKGSSRRLVNFLRRYSRPGHGSNGGLLKQWALIEMRDVGLRKDLICPCGRTGLRYICFIRNQFTNVQTYVGSTCIRKFTNKHVPRMLKLLESLSVSGIMARYVGTAGDHGRHRFAIRPRCRLVQHRILLQHFFSSLPFSKKGCCWNMLVYIRHNKYTFRTPPLQRGKWYSLTLGPVTRKTGKQARPGLVFYADRIRKVGR